ncbi:hypothetical protein PGT21_007859, partial [Puccinia graminis f. sp. tritici]
MTLMTGVCWNFCALCALCAIRSAILSLHSLHSYRFSPQSSDFFFKQRLNFILVKRLASFLTRHRLLNNSVSKLVIASRSFQHNRNRPNQLRQNHKSNVLSKQYLRWALLSLSRLPPPAVSDTSSSILSSEISKTNPLLGLSSPSLSTIIYLLNNSSFHFHSTTLLLFPLSLHSLSHLPTCSLPLATISIHIKLNSASSHPYSADSLSRNTHLATANL